MTADSSWRHIRRDSIYSLAALAAFGLKGWTLRRAFRQGLRRLKFGRLVLVRGADLEQFLLSKTSGSECEL